MHKKEFPGRPRRGTGRDQITPVSRKFLWRVIDALDDPLFVKDERHRWVLLNERLCRLLGHNRKELIGKSDYDYTPKSEADIFWEKDEQVLRTGVPNLNEEQVTWGGRRYAIATKKSLCIDPVGGRRYIVGTIRDITELKRLEKEREQIIGRLRRALGRIRIMSKTDFLTTLLNRKGIIEVAVNEMKRAVRMQENLARYRGRGRRRSDRKRRDKAAADLGVFTCAMMDIDDFKRLNDTYGHLTGDKVLRGVGAVLADKNLLRETDWAGRYGGEEFLLVFPETAARNALVPLRKVFAAIRELTFKSGRPGPLRITVSVGVAQYTRRDKTIDDVIRRADRALYRAKARGKDRIVVG